MDKETAKAINNLAKQMNEIQRQMDAFSSMLSEQNKADIDYLAMMTGIEIDSDEGEM